VTDCERNAMNAVDTVAPCKFPGIWVDGLRLGLVPFVSGADKLIDCAAKVFPRGPKTIDPASLTAF